MINIKRERWVIIKNNNEILVDCIIAPVFSSLDTTKVLNVIKFDSKKDAIMSFNRTKLGPYDGETYKAIEVTEIITDCDTDEEEN